MKVLLICMCALIALLHIGSAVFSGAVRRVLTYISVAMHPLLMIPLMLIAVPLDLVALIFLSSAAFYALLSYIVQNIRKSSSSERSEEVADK